MRTLLDLDTQSVGAVDACNLEDTFGYSSNSSSASRLYPGHEKRMREHSKRVRAVERRKRTWDERRERLYRLEMAGRIDELAAILFSHRMPGGRRQPRDEEECA